VINNKNMTNQQLLHNKHYAKYINLLINKFLFLSIRVVIVLKQKQLRLYRLVRDVMTP
jgi:hypothetical protein